MKVEITSIEVARQICGKLKYSDKEPVTENLSGNEPHSERWWRLHPKFEDSIDRPAHAVEGYRRIAAYTELAKIDGAFPALFEFLSSPAGRPDKGIIKYLLEKKYVHLQGVPNGGEPYFKVTTAGKKAFEARFFK